VTSTEPRTPAPKPGEERDPELGALTLPDDGQFDEEQTTAFDWLGRPPELFYDLDKVIERADRTWVKRVEDCLSADGRGRSVEAAITLPIRQATPQLEKPEDDKGQTEFCEEALFAPVEAGGMRTPMAEFIGQVANALLIRRTYHEKVFTRREDGKVVYKKLAWRPPESCEVWRDVRTAEILGFRQYQYLDQNGNPVGAESSDPWDENDPTWRTVRQPYAFVYTHGKHRDPIRGISDMEVVVWAHEMKMKIVWLWQAFLDGQATPRVAVYGQDKPEVEKRARAMATLRGGGVAGFIRKGDENVFDTIESPGTGATAFQEMIRWLDNVASESVMAGHLGLTGGATEGRGSLALSQDASGLYLASRQGVAREIADSITADIVAPLVAINFGVGTSVPRFTFESVDTSKTAHIMEMFNTLSTAGSTQIPQEFILLLMELVAQYLDLPTDKVEAMIEEQEKVIQQGREAAAKMNEATINGEVPAVDEDGKPVAGPGSPVGDKVGAAAAVVGAARAKKAAEEE
jgi:hypothetical protein